MPTAKSPQMTANYLPVRNSKHDSNIHQVFSLIKKPILIYNLCQNFYKICAIIIIRYIRKLNIKWQRKKKKQEKK